MNVIEIKNVSKEFVLPLEKRDTLKEHFWSVFRPTASRKLHVLNDISFDIKKGEWFGIVGRNGCGKSTLLKIMAGIFESTSGDVIVHGKLIPFLELGVGFNPDLTARENIFLNGSMLGITRKIIEARFDEIVAFAEIDDFLDMQLKNYSSGMQVRLAFAIAIQAEGDVYLLDEVLAVGDAMFQEKCINIFNQMKREGKTVIIVSHDSNFIAQQCDRVAYISDGKIVKVGKSSEVMQEYISLASDKARKTKNKDIDEGRVEEKKEFTIDDVLILDGDGDQEVSFSTGDNFRIRVNFSAHQETKKEVNFGVAIFSERGEYVYGTNTLIHRDEKIDYLKRSYCEIEYLDVQLKTGAYYVKCSIIGEDDSVQYDFLDKSETFRFFSNKRTQGLVEIKYNWK